MTIYRSETFTAGTLTASEQWDTTAGTYTRTQNGTTVETRALTPAETAALAARETADTAQANRETLTAALAANIATLLTSVTALNGITALTNATINANPAAVIKDLAREAKTIARQTIRLARLVGNTLDSADTGS